MMLVLLAVIIAQTTPHSPAEFDSKTWERERTKWSEILEKSPDDLNAISRRGDAHFFLGDFQPALADYDRMIEKSPQLQAGHWRRGIALFFAEKYADGAKQFGDYHATDQIDRENGIWRYLCQARAIGKEKARAQLLVYTTDDREPLVALYDLFSGKVDVETILKSIESANIPKAEREKRLFYAHLYIGLFLMVEDQPKEAVIHFRRAEKNTWPQNAGYGPHFMWHVARLQANILEKEQFKRLIP